jgi:hypothetical protein
MQQNTKPTIERIDFGEYEDEIKRIWNGEPPTKLVQDIKNGKRGVNRFYNAGTMKSRYGRIQKLVGYGSNAVGLCCKCKNFNVYILKNKLMVLF